jgi:hypothetical protein
MLSEHKRLLHLLEYVAIANGVNGLICWFLAATSIVPTESLKPYVLVGFAMIFLVFGAMVWAKYEYTQVIRTNWLGKKEVDDNDMSWADWKAITRWCPNWLLWLSLSAVVVSVVSGFYYGGGRWSIGDAFTEHRAVVFALSVVLFSFAAAPVLASAARMPGTFEDQFDTT